MPETQPTQENRKLRLMTPLGEDVLLPVRFNGFEALSSLFHFEIECFSARPDLDPDKIVGANVTVGIRRPDGDERFFNGIVSRFRQLETTLEATRYELEIVPWLWLLDHATACSSSASTGVQRAGTRGAHRHPSARSGSLVDYY